MRFNSILIRISRTGRGTLTARVIQYDAEGEVLGRNLLPSRNIIRIEKAELECKRILNHVCKNINFITV